MLAFALGCSRGEPPAAPEPSFFRGAPTLQIAEAPPPPDIRRPDLLIPNTRPEANLVGKPGAYVPDSASVAAHRRLHGAYGAAPGGGDDSEMGMDLLGEVAVYNTNDVQMDIQIPNPAWPLTAFVFAPTATPPRSGCLEMVPIHSRPSGSGSTIHQFGWWDWCNAVNFILTEDLTPDWLADYTRVQNGEPRSYSIVMPEMLGPPDGGCWRGLLFNFDRNAWEIKARSCGWPQRSNPERGWDFWEGKNIANNASTNCPFLRGIRASFIQSMNDAGQWHDLRGWSWRTAGGPCWRTGRYTMRSDGISPVSWNAFTPNGS